jgi:hypothetical protein
MTKQHIVEAVLGLGLLLCILVTTLGLETLPRYMMRYLLESNLIYQGF